MSHSLHVDPDPDAVNEEYLNQIISEIKIRTDYTEESDEQKNYENEIETINKSFPDEGSYIPQAYKDKMNSLETKKLSNIRTILNDDKGFQELKSKLPILEKRYKELQKSLPNRPSPPKSATRTQKAYTYVTNLKNTSDINMDEYNAKNNEFNTKMKIKQMIDDIKRLIPIYDDTRTSGGKRRTRRRRASKKSKKSKKSKNKSKRRR